MLKSLRIPSALIISFFCSATPVQADEQLLDGVRPFICDGEDIVLLETDDGWVIPNEPEADVRATANGWRYEEPFDGDVWYLREESQNSWVIEGLSEYGHLKTDCIDLATNVSKVVSIIAPKLDENIEQIKKTLEETIQELTATKELYFDLTSKHTGMLQSFNDLEQKHSSLLRRVDDMNATPVMKENFTSMVSSSVATCWNVGSLSSEAMRTTVVVRVSLLQNAKPVQGSIRLISSEGGSSTAARQAFETARRAIIRCGTRGFNLPVETYNAWKEIEITFEPSTMRVR